jgi:hypothetical protein
MAIQDKIVLTNGKSTDWTGTPPNMSLIYFIVEKTGVPKGRYCPKSSAQANTTNHSSQYCLKRRQYLGRFYFRLSNPSQTIKNKVDYVLRRPWPVLSNQSQIAIVMNARNIENE